MPGETAREGVTGKPPAGSKDALGLPSPQGYEITTTNPCVQVNLTPQGCKRSAFLGLVVFNQIYRMTVTVSRGVG